MFSRALFSGKHLTFHAIFWKYTAELMIYYYFMETCQIIVRYNQLTQLLRPFKPKRCTKMSCKRWHFDGTTRTTAGLGIGTGCQGPLRLGLKKNKRYVVTGATVVQNKGLQLGLVPTPTAQEDGVKRKLRPTKTSN